jgi:hypothetical protein
VGKEEWGRRRAASVPIGMPPRRLVAINPPRTKPLNTSVDREVTPHVMTPVKSRA